MPLEVVPVAYGPAAHEALARHVALAKAGDPLRPVTVVVPSNHVGVAARRRLAAGAGLIGVTFLTAYRLAELLGAAALAAEGRRPVSNPVLLVAVQEELQRSAGVFEAVRHHPATEEAMVAAHKQLADLSPAALARLAGASRQAATVVGIHQRVKARLAEWYDEADLVAAATDELARQHPVAGGLGTVVVFLPQELSQRTARLLGALADRSPVTVLAGHTGVADVDAGVLRSLTWFGWSGDAGSFEHDGAGRRSDDPADLRVISASDSDEEVRAAVEAAVGLARAGTPLERIAIVHGGGAHHAALIHHHLDAAELPWNGAGQDRLADAVAGRTLLRILALADGPPLRHHVFGVLAGAPVRQPDGRRSAPAVAWERRSREAGVVGTTRAEWHDRLTRLATAKEAEAEARLADDREAAARRLRRDAEQALELRDFVLGLLERLDSVAALTTWRELAAEAAGLLDGYLGDRARAAWPDREREAAEQVDAAIDRLGRLDTVAPAASLHRFARALALELEADLGRRGRFGDGVLVGPLSLALGLDLDAVVVVGMAEGVLPTRPRDDPLLPDRDREAVAPELPVAADRQRREHRQLLAAVAGAPTVVLTYPRGDLHRTTEHVASRWLLDLIDARTGRRWWSDELLEAREPWLTHVPSFAAAVRAGGASSPSTEQLARLANVVAGHPLPDDTPYHLARRLLDARVQPGFTPYDANLAGSRIPSPAASGQVVSPTRLESWSACPYAYFVRYLLGVEPVEDPEAIVRLSAMEQGSLVHAVLERYVAERIDEGTAGGRADLDALRRHTELAFGQAERRGVTGRPLLWRLQQTELARALAAFAVADAERCREDRLEPLAAELRFGFSDGSAEVTLSDGRTLRFRGSIDRVDRAGDEQLVVTDYKYSTTRKYEGLTQENPTASGTLLQLPIYAVAARDRFDDGRLPLPVRARYAFARPDRDGKLPAPKELEVDGVVLDAWRDALEVIVAGIEQGHFPARPGEDLSRYTGYVACPACDPDDLGTTDLRRRWEQLATVPELATYVQLLGLDDGQDDAQDGDDG